MARLKSPLFSVDSFIASRRPQRSSRWLGCIVVTLATLLPTVLLFIPNVGFAMDWNNCAFLAGYQAQSLRVFGHFSTTLNTAEVLGVPFPVFYGPLFFRLCAIGSLLFGTDIALRLVIIACFAAQAGAIWYASMKAGATKLAATALTIAVGFAVYPLTNLYNRSDIAELVSVALIFTSTALWFAQVYQMRVARTLSLSLAGACCFAMTIVAGTHAITAAIGGVFFFTVCVGSVLTEPRDLRRRYITFIGLVAIAFGIGLLPLIIAVVSVPPTSAMLKLTTGVLWYPDSIDSLLARLSPASIDPRSLVAGTIGVSTPYLESTVNLSLIIMAGAAAIVSRSKNAAAALAIAGGLCVFSLIPGAWFGLSRMLAPIQFAYRLTSYIDLFLLVAIFASFAHNRMRFVPNQRILGAYVCAIVLTASSMNLITKLLHASTAIHAFSAQTANAPTGTDAAYTHLPDSFYGVYDYMTDRVDLPLLAAFRPSDVPLVEMSHFGATGGMLRSGVLHFIPTRIQLFSWNDVIVNGHRLGSDQIRRYSIAGLGSFAGFQSRRPLNAVSFATRPPTVWSISMRVVLLLVFAEVAFLLFAVGRSVVRVRRRSTMEAH